MNVPTLALGATVVNFGVTAKVVDFFKAAGGTSDVDGWPMLEAIDDDGSTGGGKWLADPKLCAIVKPAPAAKAAKRKRVTVKMVCLECGRSIRISPNAASDPDCPKCGGADWDVAIDQ